jgi:hypothetical protein
LVKRNIHRGAAGIWVVKREHGRKENESGFYLGERHGFDWRCDWYLSISFCWKYNRKYRWMMVNEMFKLF